MRNTISFENVMIFANKSLYKICRIENVTSMEISAD